MQCEYECELDSGENVFLLLYYYLKSCKIKKVESEVKLLRLWCECVLSWSYVVQKGEREIIFFKGYNKDSADAC